MMATTGAGMTEFNAGLKEEGFGIRIQGTKQDHKDGRRRRIVPNTGRIMMLKPALQVKQLRRHLKKAKSPMLIGDMRRSYALMCQEAGIPYNRVQQYMGHLPRKVTDGYLKSDAVTLLRNDGEKLRAWITKHEYSKK